MKDRTTTLACSFRREPLQIQAGFLGRHHQRKHCSIGCDDQIVREPAFEAQSGNAEGAVLVVLLSVDGVVAGFRNSPGHPALPPVFDLPGNCGPAGLVEERALIRGHHQERHQIFEHGTAPGNEDRISANVREQAAQGKPALLRELPQRNPHEAAESGFRSQQIVVTRIPPAAVHVVPVKTFVKAVCKSIVHTL